MKSAIDRSVTISTVSAPRISLIQPKQSPINLGIISLPLAELGTSENPSFVVDRFVSILEQFRIVISGISPKTLEPLQRLLGQDFEKANSISLSDATSCLRYISQFVGNPVRYDDPPRDSKKLESANQFFTWFVGLFKEAKDFLVMFDDYSRSSCLDQREKALTQELRKLKIISDNEVISIRSSQGADPQSSNMMISYWIMHKDSEFEPRFILNLLRNGSGSGYTKTSEGSFHFSLQLMPGSSPLEELLAAFKTDVSRHILAASESEKDFQEKLMFSQPFLPVTMRLADQIPMVRFAKKSQYYIGSSAIKAGDVLGQGEAKTGFPSIAAAINAAVPVINGHYERAHGGNADLVKRFVYPAYFPEVAEVGRALKALSADISSLVSQYHNYFSARVGSYDNPRYEAHFFPWLFKAYDYGGGYTTHVQYDVNNVFSGFDWLKGVLNQAGSEAPLLVDLATRIQTFEQSPAGSEFKALFSASGDSMRKYPRMMSMRMEIMEMDYFYREESHSPKYIRRPKAQYGGIGGESIASQACSISNKYPEEVALLWDTLREFEYLLTWTNFFSNPKIDSCFANIDISSKDLKIVNGQNLPLVLRREFDELADISVTPNTIELTAEFPALMLNGTNGGGKTHLLEMVVHNLFLAHRNLRILGQEMVTPLISNFNYAVNASTHQELRSSFQNEVAELVQILLNADQALPGSKGLLALDEAFRGTDKRDAIPLLVGLLVYLKRRDIFFLGSTHFNSFGHLSDEFERYNLGVRSCTMVPGEFRMIEGVGNSGGIKSAEARGLESQIVEIAKQVAENTYVPNHLRNLPLIQSAATPQYSRDIADELGIQRIGQMSDWGRYKQIGAALHSFGKYAIWQTTEYERNDYGENEKFIGLSPPAAEALIGIITRSVSDQCRQQRKDLIEHQRKSVWSNKIEESLVDLSNLWSILVMDQKPRMNADQIRDRLEFGMLSSQEIQDRKIAFDRFKQSVVAKPFSKIFSAIEQIAHSLLDLPEGELKEAVLKINNFVAGSGYSEIKDFSKNSKFLWSGQGPYAESEWDSWIACCHKNATELRLLYLNLLEVHGFTTLVKAVVGENWCPRIESSENKIEIVRAVNTRLESKSIKVTPINFRSLNSGIVSLISGTNGGGKTQGLNTIASSLYLGNQISYAPAEILEMEKLPFIGVVISSSQHSSTESSFQNEIKRIQAIILDYIAAGKPKGGIIFLDEPFKGTSEEEAIPLLVGLFEYFSNQGVRVVCSTHFSGVFETLKQLGIEGKINPLYVDYFSEGERFSIKEGIGCSAGIRVAEELGVPSEIIEIAYAVANRMRQASL